MRYQKYRVVEVPFVNSKSWWCVERKIGLFSGWSKVYTFAHYEPNFHFNTEGEAEAACRLHIDTVARNKAHYEKLRMLQAKAKKIPIK